MARSRHGRTHWIDRDRGWKHIQREIAKARNKPHVRVGVFGAEAARDHDGIQNVDVATINEFGVTFTHPNGAEITIPERSFIRGTVDVARRKISHMRRMLQDKVLTGALTQHQALEQLGLFVRGLIQARISAGIPPPNQPATIARKGSAKPLIDTGQLRTSIQSEVKGA
jgi:hypothetical protein